MSYPEQHTPPAAGREALALLRTEDPADMLGTLHAVLPEEFPVAAETSLEADNTADTSQRPEEPALRVDATALYGPITLTEPATAFESLVAHETDSTASAAILGLDNTPLIGTLYEIAQRDDQKTTAGEPQNTAPEATKPVTDSIPVTLGREAVGAAAKEPSPGRRVTTDPTLSLESLGLTLAHIRKD